MTETTDNAGMTGGQAVPTEQFGVTTDTVSKNSTPFNSGFSKGVLIEVKKEHVGKSDVKYLVLTFVFKDVEGNRTYRHSEFAVLSGDNIDKRKNGLNVRLKHIYEAFAQFPAGGIGIGATSWEDFFDKVAVAFNTGSNGKPIFIKQDGDKKTPIIVWLKLTYDKKDNIGFPLSPNFIEKLTEHNMDKPKTIVIDKKFDRLEQAGSTPAAGMVMGGAIPPQNDFGFGD